MVQFRCRCGKMLQASEANAGRDAQCPACGALTPIPSFSEAPAPARRAGPEEDDRPRRRSRREDDEDERRPQSGGTTALYVILGVVGFFVLGCGGLAFGAYWLLSGAVGSVRSAASRMQEQNNLKQITIALHAYHDTNGRLPLGAAYRDPKTGKALLSWRVAILPFVEEQNLFTQFKLDEPWDGPNNSRLLARVPRAYQRPGETPSADGLTHYLAVTGRGTAFDEAFKGALTAPGSTRRLGLRFADFTDGLSNTLMVVTAAQGVPWTKPDDFDIDAGPIGGRLDTRYGGTNVAMGDGFTRLMTARGEGQWRAMMTAAGGEPVLPD